MIKSLDKIYECITQHKIKCKNDLKLFGITDTCTSKRNSMGSIRRKDVKN